MKKIALGTLLIVSTFNAAMATTGCLNSPALSKKVVSKETTFSSGWIEEQEVNGQQIALLGKCNRTGFLVSECSVTGVEKQDESILSDPMNFDLVLKYRVTVKGTKHKYVKKNKAELKEEQCKKLHICKLLAQNPYDNGQKETQELEKIIALSNKIKCN